MATTPKKKPAAKKSTAKKTPAKKAAARTSSVSVISQPDQPVLLITIWLVLIVVFLVLVATKR
jgi:hypothetical protein